MIFACTAATLWGQHYSDPLRKATHRRQAWAKARVQAISDRVTANLADDGEKALALYRWVARHIRYDSRALSKGRLPNCESWRTLRRRKAVCMGTSILYMELCEAQGIPAEVVLGEAKSYDYYEGYRFTRAEHAWNAVQVGGDWRLVDATWGSGALILRKQPLRRVLFELFQIPFRQRFRFKRRVTDDWFGIPPRPLLETHMPISPMWQLLDPAERLASFEAKVGLPKEFDLPNPYPGEIARLEGKEYAPKVLIEGKDGLEFNPRDHLDLALAQTLNGLETMYQLPELGDDTAAWNEGVRQFKEARVELARWYKSNGDEHHLRIKELAGFERRLGKVIRRIRGQERLNHTDLRRHAKNHARNLRKWISAEKTAFNRAERAILSGRLPRQASKPDSAKANAQEKQAVACLQRADSMHRKVDSLHRASLSRLSEYKSVADSLSSTYAQSKFHLEGGVYFWMSGMEIHFSDALTVMDSISAQLPRQRGRRIRRNGEVHLAYRLAQSQSLKATNHYLLAAKFTARAYQLGSTEEFAALRSESVAQLRAEQSRREQDWADIEAGITWTKENLKTNERIARRLMRLAKRELLGLRLSFDRQRRLADKRYLNDRKIGKRASRLAARGILTLRTWVGEAKQRSVGKEVPMRFYLPRRMRR